MGLDLEIVGTSAPDTSAAASKPGRPRRNTSKAAPPAPGPAAEPDELEQDFLPGVLDSPLIGAVKNERSVMVYNFFSLAKEKRTEPIRYHDGAVTIEVKGTDAGIATIYDKEILVYAVSLLVDRLNKGERASPWVTFTAHDFFRVARITPGGSSYDRVSGALERLQGTQVRTNIETGGEGTDDWFSWFAQAKAVYRKDPETRERRLQHVRVQLCDWLYRAILKDRRFLTYDSAYFDLPALDKRLYEMARAHCGNQAGFRMGLQKLRLRVGSEMDDRNFKVQLKKIAAKRKPLPEYAFKILDTVTVDGVSKRLPLARNIVVFWRLDRWREFDAEAFPEADEA